MKKINNGKPLEKKKKKMMIFQVLVVKEGKKGKKKKHKKINKEESDLNNLIGAKTGDRETMRRRSRRVKKGQERGRKIRV